MPRLLFLAYKTVYPITSGEKIRMMQNITFLSKRYDIDIAMLCEQAPKEDHIQALKAYAKNVYAFPINPLPLRAWHCLTALCTGKPLQNGYFYSRKMHSFIRREYKNYDIIFCENLRTAQYVKDLKGPVKVLDAPDCSTLNSLNERNSSHGLRKILFSFDYRNTKRFESRYYRNFDLCFFICDRDLNEAITMDPALKGKTFLLYNYARDLGYRPDNRHIDPAHPSLCFLGRVKYGPNTAAIQFFLKEVMPKLREKFPGLVLNVYGGDVEESMKALEHDYPVVFHGFVDDVAGELQRNTVAVAPMISGSGTQNKILECMRLRLCVITTRIGADGLSGLTGKELIVSESAEELIQNCLHYLDSANEAERDAVGDEGARYVKKNYSIEAVEAQLFDRLDEVVGK